MAKKSYTLAGWGKGGGSKGERGGEKVETPKRHPHPLYPDEGGH
jgi:hypothetical protein